ncbi:Capsular polysaccharide biosynthesis protein [Paenibacillus sp. UNC496MF]|uniref:YveK family protein n=1 Tax=Paenibacillus sp. UNC496MF TaxID=1502753 RepID=UPI0008F0890B|nr:Wzz/FepE/Etk N-terminal domain-containing protein [Paenibacillus sp. UNC496MF]SFI88075.1 Capsular polysaccharide biosynthesis protein [Paenibacillus sp. UNC496MF]
MDFELKEYVKLLKKRIWLIAVIVLVISLGTGFFSRYIIKPQYEASNKLIFTADKQEEGSNVITDDVDASIKLVGLYKELLVSPATLQQVVTNHPDLNVTAASLAGMIQVEKITDAPIINVTVTSESDKLSRDVLADLTHEFKSKAMNLMKSGQITVLNETATEPEPIQANMVINVVIAFVVSLMLSFGLISLLDHLDDSIKTAKDVEQGLGIPNLAFIRYTRTKDFINRSKDKPLKKIMGETAHANINQ